MPEKKKSFQELLSEAPDAAPETLSLTGALSRSSRPGKFVLKLVDGSAVTLDQEAVKAHTELGSETGQPLVRVELDPERVPVGLVPFALIASGNPIRHSSANLESI